MDFKSKAVNLGISEIESQCQLGSKSGLKRMHHWSSETNPLMLSLPCWELQRPANTSLASVALRGWHSMAWVGLLWYHGPFGHGAMEDVRQSWTHQTISCLLVLSAVKAEVKLISFLACHETTLSALAMLAFLLEIPSIFHGRKVHDLMSQPVNSPVSPPFSLMASLLVNSKPIHATDARKCWLAFQAFREAS